MTFSPFLESISAQKQLHRGTGLTRVSRKRLDFSRSVHWTNLTEENMVNVSCLQTQWCKLKNNWSEFTFWQWEIRRSGHKRHVSPRCSQVLVGVVLAVTFDRRVQEGQLLVIVLQLQDPAAQVQAALWGEGTQKPVRERILYRNVFQGLVLTFCPVFNHRCLSSLTPTHSLVGIIYNKINCLGSLFSFNWQNLTTFKDVGIKCCSPLSNINNYQEPNIFLYTISFSWCMNEDSWLNMIKQQFVHSKNRFKLLCSFVVQQHLTKPNNQCNQWIRCNNYGNLQVGKKMLLKLQSLYVSFHSLRSHSN